MKIGSRNFTRKEEANIIKSSKNNKAAGPDGIPVEAQRGRGMLLETQLHQLILSILQNEKKYRNIKDT